MELLSEIKYRIVPKDRTFTLATWLTIVVALMLALTGLKIAEGKAIDPLHYISMAIIIVLVMIGFVAGRRLIIEVSPKV